MINTDSALGKKPLLNGTSFISLLLLFKPAIGTISLGGFFSFANAIEIEIADHIKILFH